MKKTLISPKEYHETLKFDKDKLPNIAEAGFVSASLISELRNPIKFLTAPPRKTTDAMEWGNMVDCLWLTPELFGVNYAVTPKDAPRRPTAAQLGAVKPAAKTIEQIKWWEDFDAKSNGKIAIDYNDYFNVQRAVHMLENHPVSKEIKENSLKQLVLSGDAPPQLGLPSGSKTKAMMDLVPVKGKYFGVIPDLKTTNDLSEGALIKTMFNFDYVIKLAFYALCLKHTGHEINHGMLIWSRNVEPFDVVVREISLNDLIFGQSVIMRRIEKLKTMTPNNIDPFLEKEAKITQLPNWVLEAYSKE